MAPLTGAPPSIRPTPCGGSLTIRSWSSCMLRRRLEVQHHQVHRQPPRLRYWWAAKSRLRVGSPSVESMVVRRMGWSPEIPWAQSSGLGVRPPPLRCSAVGRRLPPPCSGKRRKPASSWKGGGVRRGQVQLPELRLLGDPRQIQRPPPRVLVVVAVRQFEGPLHRVRHQKW